ncbi:unnamed protein product, partial [Ilex paraguariensis]
EYNDILMKRIQRLCNLRHQPYQFTVLVREIPICDEHKTHGCCVDHFFSKHHPYTYRSFHILYNSKDLEDLLNQAKAIAKKIEDLRQHSLTKKHNRGFSHSDALQINTKIERLEEMLQEVCLRIHHMRCKKMLEQK